jgi:D-glycero-alpha-D-manno-heptose-7-phosphate kinase
MIISKTPLRMSWVGGGSDMSSFYKEELGAVLSTSINKYIYIALNPKFDGKIRLNYSKTEEVSDIKQIEHPIFKQTLLHMGIKGGIEIASMADIPSKGSGLGSSSSFTVGLLNALYAFKNQYVSKEKLAIEACDIEINKCNEPIGKQDQFAAAFGGMNLIKFHGNEEVIVEPIICNPELYRNIEECTIVFFTGRTRSASDLLSRQSKELASLEKKKKMRRMVELAFELKKELENNSIINFGEILHENWLLKSELTHGITDNQINKWYNEGIRNGAKGGKLLGAGNGGFLMFFAQPQYHKNIENALAELQKVNIKFDNAGTQIVFYQPNQNI